ncbi:UDP-glycosyltransferase 83A1 [Heracleum sosnowskyi]|uniref:UDP-glycosyltransferase 83A1 n=1 Tax=Heracleum sosnowskyi TaxID=360622 RepID=A0AAD8IDK6_9APIA|nr:UDP-glycosyltransferase 83A1 [Heracleum sosnowskyi]
MGIPHVLAVPYPAQGHVIPMMELLQRFVKQGFKVTCVNTDFNHDRIMKSLNEKDSHVAGTIQMTAIPDGLGPSEDRNDFVKSLKGIFEVMPGKLEELIEMINEKEDNKITCLVADENMGWAFKVADKFGIKKVAFWPASMALLASMFNVPKLIEDKIINSNDGTVRKHQMISLSADMPAISTENMVWACFPDLETQKSVFNVILKTNEFVKLADFIICNSAYELEPAAFTLFPNLLSIGPLIATNQLGKQVGHFWPEDSTCLTWLNQQPVSSVIYVAFGSFTVFDPVQFHELALGLEQTNMPFLWVVRPDMTDAMNEAYPKGFIDRIGSRGRMVGWAPQEKVLRHPSVACFLTHCGWNSTIEGVSNGMPFLCWPYFADQFLNKSYICDVWKVGMGFDKDECGIIRQGEIKNKVEHLLCDKQYKARALDLKDKVVNSVHEQGCSNKNLSSVIDWMK